MSILIKGMEMPTRCFACPMCEISDIEICCSIPIGGVAVSYEEIDEQIAIQDRPSWCPLVEIPPHGRLIDADKAAKQGWTISRTYSASPTEMVYEVKKMTDEVLPTIIEAEESK